MVLGFLLGVVVTLLAVGGLLYLFLVEITNKFEEETKTIVQNAASANARLEREKYAAQPTLPPLPQRSAAVQREAVSLTVCWDN